MFEQTFVNTYAQARRPWTFMASAALQSLVLAAIVFLTLMHTDGLPSRLSRLGGGLPFIPLAKPPASQSSGATRAVVRPSPRTLILPDPSRLIRRESVLVDADFADAPDFRGLEHFGSRNGIGPGLPFGERLAPPPLTPTQAQPRTPTPVQTPAAPPEKRVLVGGIVQSAKLINQVKPVYPQLARAGRISGTVRLEAIISKDGAIQNLRLISGHAALVKAAMEAVRQWRYYPTLLNNVPVEVITQIEVNFTLTN